jgi:hypothetical protein
MTTIVMTTSRVLMMKLIAVELTGGASPGLFQSGYSRNQTGLPRIDAASTCKVSFVHARRTSLAVGGVFSGSDVCHSPIVRPADAKSGAQSGSAHGPFVSGQVGGTASNDTSWPLEPTRMEIMPGWSMGGLLMAIVPKSLKGFKPLVDSRYQSPTMAGVTSARWSQRSID